MSLKAEYPSFALGKIVIKYPAIKCIIVCVHLGPIHVDIMYIRSVFKYTKKYSYVFRNDHISSRLHLQLLSDAEQKIVSTLLSIFLFILFPLDCKFSRGVHICTWFSFNVLYSMFTFCPGVKNVFIWIKWSCKKNSGPAELSNSGFSSKFDLCERFIESSTISVCYTKNPLLTRDMFYVVM